MRTDPTPLPGDHAHAPFSNGTQSETWLAGCDGCIHDTTYGQADEETGAEHHCPLITLSLMHVWPQEWERREVIWDTDTGASYHVPGTCSEWTDELPAPKPDPVIAVDLFGTYQEEPPC